MQSHFNLECCLNQNGETRGLMYPLFCFAEVDGDGTRPKGSFTDDVASTLYLLFVNSMTL